MGKSSNMATFTCSATRGLLHRLHLPPAAPLHWHNVLTGEALTASGTPPAPGLSLAQILQHVPVALLTSSPAQATDAA